MKKNLFFCLGARGSARRGGPPYEGGAGRGGRSQRFNKFEGQGSTESTSFEQGGEAWSNEAGTRGGRGRGGPKRGNFEGGRGGAGGRGRGRGGRGNFNNRNQEDGSQQESGWQQNAEYVKFHQKNYLQLADKSRTFSDIDIYHIRLFRWTYLLLY